MVNYHADAAVLEGLYMGLTEFFETLGDSCKESVRSFGVQENLYATMPVNLKKFKDYISGSFNGKEADKRLDAHLKTLARIERILLSQQEEKLVR